jgi:hypothetical protein
VLDGVDTRRFRPTAGLVLALAVEKIAIDASSRMTSPPAPFADLRTNGETVAGPRFVPRHDMRPVEHLGFAGLAADGSRSLAQGPARRCPLRSLV